MRRKWTPKLTRSRRLWPRRPLIRRREIKSRRLFLVRGLLFVAAGLAFTFRWLKQPSLQRGSDGFRAKTLIRPPMANIDDAAFQRSCIRCGLCGTVCKSGCIRFFGLDGESEHGAFTPYIDVRQRSCVLCMRCTEVCPTGALSHVPDELDVIAEQVKMGMAVVDPDRCLSYQGRICGYCHDACPLPGRAIRLIPQARPVVIPDGCVGCGRCVELCPQSPTAIDVRRLDEGEARTRGLQTGVAT